jgi:hypothetical protein
MSSSTFTLTTVDRCKTEYRRKKQGRPGSDPKAKQSQPITFWETVDGEQEINAEAKRLNMSRSAFCSMAVALYINSTRDIG